MFLQSVGRELLAVDTEPRKCVSGERQEGTLEGLCCGFSHPAGATRCGDNCLSALLQPRRGSAQARCFPPEEVPLPGSHSGQSPRP